MYVCPQSHVGSVTCTVLAVLTPQQVANSATDPTSSPWRAGCHHLGRTTAWTSSCPSLARGYFLLHESNQSLGVREQLRWGAQQGGGAQEELAWGGVPLKRTGTSTGLGSVVKNYIKQ